LATLACGPFGTFEEGFATLTARERGAVLDDASHLQHVSAEARLIRGNIAFGRKPVPRVNNKGHQQVTSTDVSTSAFLPDGTRSPLDGITNRI
jgi:hypothetical protein